MRKLIFVIALLQVFYCRSQDEGFKKNNLSVSFAFGHTKHWTHISVPYSYREDGFTGSPGPDVSVFLPVTYKPNFKYYGNISYRHNINSKFNYELSVSYLRDQYESFREQDSIIKYKPIVDSVIQNAYSPYISDYLNYKKNENFVLLTSSFGIKLWKFTINTGVLINIFTLNNSKYDFYEKESTSYSWTEYFESGDIMFTTEIVSLFAFAFTPCFKVEFQPFDKYPISAFAEITNDLVVGLKYRIF